jgi:hypothetical protein
MSRRGRSRSPFSLFSFQDIITCVSGIVILVTLVLALELSQRKQGSPQVQTVQLVARLQEAIADAQAEVARLDAELRHGTDKARELAGVSAVAVQHELIAVNEQIASLEAEIESLRKQEELIAKKDDELQAQQFDRQKDQQKIADIETTIHELEAKLRRVRQQQQLFYNSRTADGKQVWLVQLEGDRMLVAPAGPAAKATLFSQRLAMLRHSAFAGWLAKRSASKDFFFLLVRPGATAEFSEISQLLTKKGFTTGFDLLSPRQSAVDPEKGAAGL